jgi:hypothetical protein
VRALPFIVTAVLVLAGAAIVHAAERAATDRRTGVGFQLDGHLLTATILPREPQFVQKTPARLQGRRVTAVCGTRLAAGRGRTTHRTRRWSRARSQLKFWLPRDVSAHVRWCVLETGKTGGDVASAYFKRRK